MLQKGFSIFELLAVFTVLGIMLLMSIPYAQNLFGRNRALTYANEIRSTLQFARSSAIRFGKPVTFCGSKDHKKCDGLWQEGSIVVTSSHEILRVLPKVYSGDKLIWCGSAITQEGITFLPREFLYGQQGSFYYYPKNDLAYGLAVILWITGRVRLGRIHVNNFVFDQNSSISCDSMSSIPI